MRHLLTLLVLGLCPFAHAQQNPATAPKLPIIRLQDGSISGLGPIYSHGTGFWIAATDQTAILGCAEELGDTFVVSIAIRNTSDSIFTFDSAEVKAFDIVAGKYLTNIPAKTLAGKIRQPGTWARFAQGFGQGAALASQQTTKQQTTSLDGTFNGQTYEGDSFRGNFSGTATANTTTCDDACAQAQANLMGRFRAEDQRRLQQADAVESAGLAKETIAPGSQIMGYIYFSKPKKGRAPKPSGGQLEKSLDVNVLLPVAGDKFRLFFPTELFEELTRQH
jgi:hypothetical protein